MTWIGPLSWGYDPQDDPGYEPSEYPDGDGRDQDPPLSDAEPTDPELAGYLIGEPVFSDHEHMRQEVDSMDRAS